VASIRADLETARRLAPRNAIVLAAQGYFLLSQQQNAEALAALEAAERAGLAEPEWLLPKTRALIRSSRIEEALSAHRRMVTIDPGSPINLFFAALDLTLARQPAEASRIAELARPQVPAGSDYFRALIALAYQGSTREMRAYQDRYETADPAALLRAPRRLEDQFTLLRFEGRFEELKSRLDRLHFETVRFPSAGYQIIDAVGLQWPIAEYRGWTDLLRGDRTAAQSDGRKVLEFVARQPQTRRNRFYLQWLLATGYTFTQDCDRAVTAADASLASVAELQDALAWIATASTAARVYAWCKKPDEAVRLLEQLATRPLGLGPALITRDPLYSRPLGAHAGYQTLAAKLEKEIRATRLE
jgi:tetratricopeptide (TPR) repeat protein